MSVLPPVPDRVISNGNNLTPPWEAWFRQLYNYLTASVAGGGAGIVTSTSNFNVSEVLSFGDGEDNDWPMPMPTVQQTSAAGSSNYIQYNSSGAFAASIKYQWDDTANTMTLGTGLTGTISYIKAADSTGAGNPLYLYAGAGADIGAGAGGDLRLYGGAASDLSQIGTPTGGSMYMFAGNGGGDTGYGLTGNGGSVQIKSGNGTSIGDYGNGGAISILGGSGLGQVSGNGGSITIQSGNSQSLTGGNAGNIVIRAGDVTTDGYGGNLTLRAGKGVNAGSGGVNGSIYFVVNGATYATYSGANGALTLNSSSSGSTLTIGAAPAGSQTLWIDGNGASNAALRVNASATTGTQTATWTPPTNKPGAALGTVSKWLPINLDGTKYYIPCWT